MTCQNGTMVDSCVATCEAACNDFVDEDRDGARDCNDSECVDAPECQLGPTKVGNTCTTDAECGNNGICALTFPGGYCHTICDASLPNDGCPAGSTCYGDSACVLGCDAGGQCSGGDRSDLACTSLEPLNGIADLLCLPTCGASCPDGTVCDPATSVCQPPAACQPVDSVDVSCNGVDDDCDGNIDDDFATQATSCGSGACASTGSSSCQNGSEIDDCVVTCEGACADGQDDDGDAAIDCADSDCASASACAPSSGSGIGSPCTVDADCAQGQACETAFPGGYCYAACDPSQPAGQECPGGTTCWLGSACVVPCNAGSACDDPRLTCGGFESAGLPPDPFCHPTCIESCVNGASCDPNTSLCF
jgi:hypothetical protein